MDSSIVSMETYRYSPIWRVIFDNGMILVPPVVDTFGAIPPSEEKVSRCSDRKSKQGGIITGGTDKVLSGPLGQYGKGEIDGTVKVCFSKPNSVKSLAVSGRNRWSREGSVGSVGVLWGNRLYRQGSFWALAEIGGTFN